MFRLSCNHPWKVHPCLFEPYGGISGWSI